MRGEASQVCLFDFHLHAQVCVDLCSFRWPVKVSQSLSATIRPPYSGNLCQAAMLNSVEWLGQQEVSRDELCDKEGLSQHADADRNHLTSVTLAVLCPGRKIEELDPTHACCRLHLPRSQAL